MLVKIFYKQKAGKFPILVSLGFCLVYLSFQFTNSGQVITHVLRTVNYRACLKPYSSTPRRKCGLLFTATYCLQVIEFMTFYEVVSHSGRGETNSTAHYTAQNLATSIKTLSVQVTPDNMLLISYCSTIKLSRHYKMP